MSLTEMQDESKFKKQLGEYWASKGITLGKIPQIGGQELNMFKLYRTVCKKGGGQAVSHNKLWKEIVDEFGLPSTCTSASFTLKNHYQKYLLGYEQRYFFGKDDSAGLPELVAGRQRRLLHKDDIYHNRISLTRPQHEQILANLSAELKKQYEKVDGKQPILFVRRSKLYPSPPQVRQMIMGFESDTVLSINTLTLLSLNTEVQFLLGQHPQVLEAIQSYLLRHFPPSNIMEVECLRSLTLALRNLLTNPKNHQPLIHSEVYPTLVALLHTPVDRQATRNLTDMFCSVCHSVPATLLSALNFDRDSHEEQETALDILRSLLQIHYPVPYYDLSRFLLFSSLEVRETAMEVLALYAERSEGARKEIISCHTLMLRVCGGMTHAQGNSERQATHAANVIKHLSKGEEHIPTLKVYEKYIVAASFNCESIACTLAEVLFKLNAY